jgi:ATP-dependent HslUV protease ATP-binding subunit HslU
MPSLADKLSPLAEADDLDKNLRPSDVVRELDRHIVGQKDAKRAVAIAMRNRWRRRQLPDDLRKEVTPRNVLMIGPTGCGKTEVARRMAALGDAPFLKVEATKFTEVGYHGRDVDQIVRDLMDVSMALTRKKKTEKLREQAKDLVEDRILDLLTGPKEGSRGRESFRDMLRQGLLDDQEVEVDVPEGGPGADRNNVFAIGDNNNPNIQAMSDFLSRMSSGQGKKAPMERKKMPISEAREVILEIELDKLLENVDLKKEAIAAVEESGIVFIDEIDKICSSRDVLSRSADASAEGVQRDLLPLIEGTTINTKYGNVNTDYILFVASGAFHAVKPSDMLPELQGRLPIRVELNGLTEDDLYKILTEPVANVSKFWFLLLLLCFAKELTFRLSVLHGIARSPTN